MTIVKAIGKNTIGQGDKMNIAMRSYEMSTHDLSARRKTTLSPGTVVPIHKILVQPGDRIGIKIHKDAITAPTTGALIGSFKFETYAFYAPMRLYQSMMQNNEVNVGMDMSSVTLPQLELSARNSYPDQRLSSNAHTNPSSVLAYLGIRGIGHGTATTPEGRMTRQFQATPYLMYYDVLKNFYYNKQEKVGYIVHTELQNQTPLPEHMYVVDINGDLQDIPQQPATVDVDLSNDSGLGIFFAAGTNLRQNRPENFLLRVNGSLYNVMEIWENATMVDDLGTAPNWQLSGRKMQGILNITQWERGPARPAFIPLLEEFDLANIDQMRRQVLQSEEGILIDYSSVAPFGMPLRFDTQGNSSAQYTQEGLGVKTYQSDIFNNWVNSEFVEQTNLSTRVDTTGGSFSMDTLNFTQKLYDLQNRISISGGSIDDWIETVWTAHKSKTVTSPVFIGGCSKEIVFQHIVSTAVTDTAGGNNPLGQLGSRGITRGDKRGGNIEFYAEEIGYILVMASITPRIDYSQGNDWDMNLKTMDDIHKPALDGIGYQDLITDNFDWRDTAKVGSDTNPPQFKSVGKQPAWLWYTTEISKALGNFAIEDNMMFMTLNRRYEWTDVEPDKGTKDKTTYIDPGKFNYAFADASIDAMNFWCEWEFEVKARRKMSARQIPNL